MVRKLVNESIISNRKPHIITKDELKELNDYLRKNDNKEYIDIYRDNNSIYVDITWGDWKHDHLWIKRLVKDFFDNKGVDVQHFNTITDEDGSDTYSAEHIWYLYDKVDNDISVDEIDKNTSETIEESASTVGAVKTLDDVLSGLIGNMPDRILDRNINLFTKIAKDLGVDDFAKLYVFIHDGSYNLNDYSDKFEVIKNYDKLFKDFEDTKLFKLGDIQLVQEFVDNGNYFIYAKSENDLDALVDVIDNYYNDTTDDSAEELTENKDTDFNDMYFPRINITNNDYDYYKYKDKEFVFDKSKNLLIYLFKDEDEVKELGDEAPYRELDAIGFNKEFWDDKDERDYHLDGYIADLDAETSSLLADYIKYELPEYQKKETVTEATVDVKALKDTHKIYEADLNVEAEISEYDASSEDEAKENSKEAVDVAVKNMAKEIKNRIDKKISKNNTYVDLSDYDLINFEDGIIYATIYVDKDANEEDIITVINELKGFVSFGETTFDDFDYSKGSPVSGPNIPNSYAGWMEYSEIESEVTIAIEIMSIENIKQSED